MTKRRALTGITIDAALNDPNLLGCAFDNPSSWAAWFAVLKAAFGRPLSHSERETFAAIAGGREPPAERVREAWMVVSRRGGKSRVAAAVATYLAAIVDHSHRLAPGEVGFVLILAATQRQARVIKSYVSGFLQASPILRREVADDTSEEIRLKNGVVIAIHSNSHRSVRGRTVLAALFDEVSYWRDELSASPDTETYRAVLPALATTGGMLVGISSPYRKAGLLYAKWKQFHGVNNPNVLVVQGATRTFNPTIDQDVIDLAASEDPEAARAEWFGEFRSDIESYISREALEACVAPGVFERPPMASVRYVGFVDPSGGVSDSMTMAVAHAEKKVAVLDAVRERKAPFSPENAVEEFAQVLKSYRLFSVTGDRYGGSWPSEAFKRHGITYRPADKSKNQIYQDVLPRVNSREVDLLDDPRLVAQLMGLERRTSRGGRDSIDHGPGSHDDVANAVAGALVNVSAQRPVPVAQSGTYHWSR